MDDLIAALQIFRKYANEPCPTHCEHDVMYVVGMEDIQVSETDLKELERLGFHYSDGEGFQSFRFGSA